MSDGGRVRHPSRDGRAPERPSDRLRQLAARVRRLSHWRGTPETFSAEQDAIAHALGRLARAVETGDPVITTGDGAAGAPVNTPVRRG